MLIDSTCLQSSRFTEIGEVIQRDRMAIAERWMERALQLQPDADPSRRQELRNALPEYLDSLSRQIARFGSDGSDSFEESGECHGKQRWQVGWSLSEVVRDYQIMRMTLLRHLDECLERLELSEIIAINSLLDDTITNAVVAYVQQSERDLRELNGSLETKVLRRTSQIRQLSRELVQAEHRERQRLSEVLHGHLQQLLFAARMRIHVAMRQDKSESTLDTLHETEQLIDESIAASRNLSIELSPPVLQEKGLTEAFAWLAGWMQELSELDVEIDSNPAFDPRSEEIKIFLFQAARELLQNVVKHAGTGSARLQLSRESDGLILTLEDSGCGFQPADNSRRQGSGLKALQQRVDLLGGSMNISSSAEHGTRVRITVPDLS